ncbi:MAG: O-antigen ligase family protein, partial [Candidatus Binataceae bacterium]
VVLFNLWFVPITPIKIVGLLMVVGAMFAAAPAAAAKRLSSAIPILYIAFAALPIALTLLFGITFPRASASALVSYGLLLIATRRLVSTPERLANVVRVLVFAETFGSLWLYKQQYILHMLNPNGPSGDSNYEALSIVMTIPLAIYLIRNDHSVMWRRIALVCTPILGFALLVSQSRGGVLALAVLIVLAWLRSSRKLMFVIVGAMLLGAAAAMAPQVTWERFQQIQISGRPTTGAELSTRTRIELWRGGLHIIEKHPIFGIGLNQFKEQVAFYNPRLIAVAGKSFIAHETYIQVWAEEGLPVLVVFLTMIGRALLNCRYAEREGCGRGGGFGELGIAMQFGLIAYMVAALFLSAQLVKTLWMFVFLSQNVREIECATKDAAAPVVEPLRTSAARRRVASYA